MKVSPHCSTFSIVARDPETKNFCVAGTSHWFQYATLVPFIEAGVGAVATQAECNLSYGKEGLRLLKNGKSPEQVVELLTSNDEQKDVRQLLIIDMAGNTASYTGNGCIEFAGHHTEQNFSLAGNMLANAKVIDEMVEYYHQSNLPLELRVLETLIVGQEAGGDLRGKRSAGLLSAQEKIDGTFWEGIAFNLRVDDNSQPLKELKRLYFLARKYQLMNQGDVEYYEKQNKKAALEAYREADRLEPENAETKFWYAKLLWDMGEKEKAQEEMSEVIKFGDQWQEFWKRVV